MTARTAWHADETSHHRDTGCDIAPACLACPLPACRYDLPPKRAAALMRVYRLQGLLAQGLSGDEIARHLGVSRRTVFRLKLLAERQRRGGERLEVTG